jgi:hypothetical protein
MARSSGRQRANLVATFIGKKTDSLTMLAARRRAAWNILPNFLFERSDNKARQNANAISMLQLRYEPTGLSRTGHCSHACSTASVTVQQKYRKQPHAK